MNNAKYIAPNFITLLNIVAGSCAILFAIEGYVWLPIYCLVAASVFDFLDGLVAKLLKATSEFGKQLDSIADIVSFGLAPSILIYKLMTLSFTKDASTDFALEASSVEERIFLLSSSILVMFAALRLARFNIIKEYSADFKGLPVPASALFVVAIWIAVHQTTQTNISDVILNKYFILVFILGLSALMVSNITMISLKFEGFGFAVNIWRYILIVISVLLYVLFGIPSLLYVMIFYVVLSIIKTITALRT